MVQDSTCPGLLAFDSLTLLIGQNSNACSQDLGAICSLFLFFSFEGGQSMNGDGSIRILSYSL